MVGAAPAVEVEVAVEQGLGQAWEEVQVPQRRAWVPEVERVETAAEAAFAATSSSQAEVAEGAAIVLQCLARRQSPTGRKAGPRGGGHLHGRGLGVRSRRLAGHRVGDDVPPGTCDARHH